MDVETPAGAQASGKPTAEDRAAAKLQADNAKVVEDAQAAQRETLDAHEAAAYARAHGEPVPDEQTEV